jgi:hypothetical protein
MQGKKEPHPRPESPGGAVVGIRRCRRHWHWGLKVPVPPVANEGVHDLPRDRLNDPDDQRAF